VLTSKDLQPDFEYSIPCYLSCQFPCHVRFGSSFYTIWLTSSAGITTPDVRNNGLDVTRHKSIEVADRVPSEFSSDIRCVYHNTVPCLRELQPAQTSSKSGLRLTQPIIGKPLGMILETIACATDCDISSRGSRRLIHYGCSPKSLRGKGLCFTRSWDQYCLLTLRCTKVRKVAGSSERKAEVEADELQMIGVSPTKHL